MRPSRLTVLATAVLPAPALAHLGHLGEVASHDHWVAGAAIGAAVVIGILGAWKGRKAGRPAEDKAGPADDGKVGPADDGKAGPADDDRETA